MSEAYDDMVPASLMETTAGVIVLLDRHNDLIATFARNLEHREIASIARCVNTHKALVEALKDAIRKITIEYCSHDGEHGAENAGCYAQEQYAALKAAAKEAP